MSRPIPRLKSSILFPVLLINFVLFVVFSLIVFQLINSSMSRVSQRQFESTLSVFSSSIRDSFLRGLDNEVDSYCRLLASGENVEAMQVTRGDDLVVCAIGSIDLLDSGQLLLKKNIFFSEDKVVAGTVAVVFSSNFYGLLIQNIVMTLFIVLVLSIVAFSLFGSWIVQRHLTPFADLANKLFKKEIFQLTDVDSIEGAGRNFEIQSLTQAVATLSKNTISYQDELVKNEKLNAINEYSRLLAHDIKAPLSGIQAGVRFLTQKPEQSTKLINSSVRRIEKMIDRILARNKIDALEAQLQTVLAQPFFVELFERLETTFAGQKVRLQSSVQASEDSSIQVDQDLFFRALCNLVKNSIEAFKEGESGTVSLNAQCSKDSWVLVIQDDGPGLPSEVLSKIGQ